jgi:hypothetical protein
MTKKYALPLFLFIILSSCEKRLDKTDILLKFYGDALEDIGYSIAKVEDGFVIAGQFTEVARTGGNLIDGESSVKKLGIIKTGTDGNVIWKKSFGDKLAAVGSKLLALGDGSVIAAGFAIDTVTLQKDIFVVKLGADGTGALQKIYKSDGNQYGIDIIKTPEGFLLLGSTDVESIPGTESSGNAAGKKDILLLRINDNLEPIVSAKTIGFPGDDEGAAIKPDINGGYIVVGTTDRSDQDPSVQAENNIFLIRINSDVSAIQSVIIGGTSDEYASDIEVLTDGYLISGTVGNEGTFQQGYVWKLSDNIYAPPVIAHEIEIETSSAAAVSFSVKAISRYKTSSFVMAGQTGTGSSAKMLVFAIDADGNVLEGKKMILGGTGIQIAYDVISDEDNNIIVVGKNSFEKNSMVSLIKFRF